MLTVEHHSLVSLSDCEELIGRLNFHSRAAEIRRREVSLLAEVYYGDFFFFLLQLWRLTHKRNGKYINDEARIIAEQIIDVEQKDENSKILSQNDSLSQVLGKDNNGWVRGLGFGPTPNKLFGHTASSSGVSQTSGHSIAHLEAHVEQLKSELATANLKANALQARQCIFENVLIALLQEQGKKVPAELEILIGTMGPDAGSGLFSSAGVGNTSSCSHDMDNG